MSRTFILSFVVVAGGAGILLAGGAQSQSGTPKNLVQLQSNTPGVSQSGHTNISGTSRAGQFVGGGTGLTNVNAALLGGLPSSAFLQGIPNPLVVNGSNATPIISGVNNANVAFAVGVSGTSTTTTTNGVGVYGASSSPSGYGVYAINNATSGLAPGLFATTTSPSGDAIYSVASGATATGVLGFADALTGVNYGVVGRSASSSGTGIYGHATDAGGSTKGVYGMAASNFGIGVSGYAPNNIGVQGRSDHPAGYGVYGLNMAASGSAPGVVGETASTIGIAVRGQCFTTTGANTGGYFSTPSNAGTGVLGIATSSTGSTFGVYGRSASNAGTAVIGESTAGSGGGVGVLGTSQSPDGTGGLFSNFVGGHALQALGKVYFDGNLLLNFNKRIGLGVPNPTFPIHFDDAVGEKISFFGANASSHYGIGIQASNLQFFNDVSASAISFGYGGSGSYTERARFSGAGDLIFQIANADIATNISTPYDLLISHDRDNDSTDSWTRLFVNGGTIEQMRITDGDEAPTNFDGAVNANGIDYAEAFKIMDPSLEAGDLVVNMGSSWEHITRSTKAYDSAVIGVISTKPAFVAGMSFDAEDRIHPELTKRRNAARLVGDVELEKSLTKQMSELVKAAYRPVAFMGRVPVKVTGRVQVGDHLTSSQIPGVAMAMNMSGQSIGIALESNPGGNGKIMVMIQPRYWTPSIPTQSGGLTEVVAVMKKKMDAVVAENRELRQRVTDLEERLSRLEKNFGKH